MEPPSGVYIGFPYSSKVTLIPLISFFSNFVTTGVDEELDELELDLLEEELDLLEEELEELDLLEEELVDFELLVEDGSLEGEEGVLGTEGTLGEDGSEGFDGMVGYVIFELEEELETIGR